MIMLMIWKKPLTPSNYMVRLNPSKCSFGIKNENFLEFYVKKQGICPNIDKIQVIIDMSPSTTIREATHLVVLSQK